MEQEKQRARGISPWEAMGLVWDLLVTIVVLTLVCAFGGVYLDRMAHTKVLFTILGFVGLIFIGKTILMKKVRKISDRMNEGTKKEQNT
jgi:uncharacterized membrane protein YfcA